MVSGRESAPQDQVKRLYRIVVVTDLSAHAAAVLSGLCVLRFYLGRCRQHLKSQRSRRTSAEVAESSKGPVAFGEIEELPKNAVGSFL